MERKTIVVMEGDETGQELLEESDLEARLRCAEDHLVGVTPLSLDSTGRVLARRRRPG